MKSMKIVLDKRLHQDELEVELGIKLDKNDSEAFE